MGACLSLGVLPSVVLIYLASLIVGCQVCKLEAAVSRFDLSSVNRAHIRVNRKRLLALNRRELTRACLTAGLFESALGRLGARRALALCAQKSVSLTGIYKQMSLAFCSRVRPPVYAAASRCGVVLAVLASAYKRIAV